MDAYVVRLYVPSAGCFQFGIPAPLRREQVACLAASGLFDEIRVQDLRDSGRESYFRSGDMARLVSEVEAERAVKVEVDVKFDVDELQRLVATALQRKAARS